LPSRGFVVLRARLVLIAASHIILIEAKIILGD